MWGPAENVTILATAFADKEHRGSGRHEPMLMAISYGKGRVFHTTLGHDVQHLKSVSFIVTFLRGAEWAATGKVTIPVPDDFPGKDEPTFRE
jgi:type 1 glutamine amidotransferase